MNIDSKVLVLPNECGLEIDLSAEAIPTTNPSLQSFYNTYVQNGEAKQAYTSPSKLRFTEKSTQTRPGDIFTQQIRLEFPSNDPMRSLRLTEYTKVKYLYLKLSGGMVLFFGRNDYFQNTPPKVTTASNSKTTQIIYTVKSMAPAGFTNGSFDYNLPEEFPINFYNLNL